MLRDRDTAIAVRERTTLPVLLAADFAELRGFYDELDAKVAVYCNNSPSNFDSLLDNRMLHVHINHGESDKQSMASNNAKSYDRVFVAGQAAVERYESALLEFDSDRLVRIGRPQLDLERVPALMPNPRRTVLYAPTWSRRRGLQQLLLGRHDRTADRAPGARRARRTPGLQAAPSGRDQCRPRRPLRASGDPPARVRGRRRSIQRLGTAALLHADILAVMPACDAMVADVSSVGLDWLYLRTDRPLFITDRHDDPERLRLAHP